MLGLKFALPASTPPEHVAPTVDATALIKLFDATGHAPSVHVMLCWLQVVVHVSPADALSYQALADEPDDEPDEPPAHAQTMVQGASSVKPQPLPVV